MKINTVIIQSSDWKVRVHTSSSQYKNQGPYWTCCSLLFHNGTSVILVSRYNKTQSLAAAFHLEIASKAKDFFSLKV